MLPLCRATPSTSCKPGMYLHAAVWGPSMQTQFCAWKEALESNKMAYWVQSSPTGLIRASQVPQVSRVTLWHVGAMRSSLPLEIHGEKLSFSFGAAAKLKFCKFSFPGLHCFQLFREQSNWFLCVCVCCLIMEVTVVLFYYLCVHISSVLMSSGQASWMAFTCLVAWKIN